MAAKTWCGHIPTSTNPQARLPRPILTSLPPGPLGQGVIEVIPAKVEVIRCGGRVSVQGVISLGGHFVYLCQEFDFMSKNNIIIFKKEKVNTFTLLIIFIVKSLQKERNSTNLLQ